MGQAGVELDFVQWLNTDMVKALLMEEGASCPVCRVTVLD